VEENAYATPKQTPKHNATTKNNRPQLRSCGTPQNATPTQREKPQFCQSNIEEEMNYIGKNSQKHAKTN
jgi:hypothetical protein